MGVNQESFRRDGGGGPCQENRGRKGSEKAPRLRLKGSKRRRRERAEGHLGEEKDHQRRVEGGEGPGGKGRQGGRRAAHSKKDSKETRIRCKVHETILKEKVERKPNKLRKVGETEFQS